MPIKEIVLKEGVKHNCSHLHLFMFQDAQIHVISKVLVLLENYH